MHQNKNSSTIELNQFLILYLPKFLQVSMTLYLSRLFVNLFVVMDYFSLSLSVDEWKLTGQISPSIQNVPSKS